MITHLIYQEKNGEFLHITLNEEAGLMIVIDERGKIIMKREGMTRKELKDVCEYFMQLNNKEVSTVGI